MSGVVQGRFRRYSGKAHCLTCKHEWQAQSDEPAGLECPNCKSLRGLFQMLFEPPAGTMIFVCACECEHFTITARGMYCIGCACVYPHTQIMEGWHD